jgi:hypothetical protein
VINMKTFGILCVLCALTGCANGRGSAADPTPSPIGDLDAGMKTDDADAMVAESPIDASMPPPPKPKPEPEPEPEPKPKPKPKPDAEVPEPEPIADAGMDAGPTPDGGGHPVVDAGPGHDGTLRNLTVHLTGMEDDIHHFAQFRIRTLDGDFFLMFVIHEGMTSADYQFTLPNSLVVGDGYTLDFFIDHNERTGLGFYDKPAIDSDHAWSVPIPAEGGDVAIDFPYNTDYFDIEAQAPNQFHSLILSSSDMDPYIGSLVDVRITDTATGRLVGRQLREVPGGTFDLTIGATVHEGVEYIVDISVDANGDGEVDPDTDPQWSIVATATVTGLHLPFSASSPEAPPESL